MLLFRPAHLPTLRENAIPHRSPLFLARLPFFSSKRIGFVYRLNYIAEALHLSAFGGNATERRSLKARGFFLVRNWNLPEAENIIAQPALSLSKGEPGVKCNRIFKRRIHRRYKLVINKHAPQVNFFFTLLKGKREDIVQWTMGQICGMLKAWKEISASLHYAEPRSRFMLHAPFLPYSTGNRFAETQLRMACHYFWPGFPSFLRKNRFRLSLKSHGRSIANAAERRSLKARSFFWCNIEKPQRGGIMVAPGKADEGGRNPGLYASAFLMRRIRRRYKLVINKHAPEGKWLSKILFFFWRAKVRT